MDLIVLAAQIALLIFLTTKKNGLPSHVAIPIGMISEQLNYSDTSHFTRAFRRWTGEGPQIFRNRER